MSTFASVRSRRRGFTMIEVLVVIAIMAILMALVIAAVYKVGITALDYSCRNNLYNIGRAVYAAQCFTRVLATEWFRGPLNRSPAGTLPIGLLSATAFQRPRYFLDAAVYRCCHEALLFLSCRPQ